MCILDINDIKNVTVNGNWRYIRSCAWLGEPGVGRDERYDFNLCWNKMNIK